MAHNEYDMASEVYSEVLSAAENIYDQNDPNLCKIYLEYAASLIRGSEEHFVNELEKMVSKRTVGSSRDDDLNIAWDVLEISKSVFIANKDHNDLAQTFYLLGDILLLNNDFTGAITEYVSSIVEIKKCAGKNTLSESEVFYKMATCYEFMEEYEKCVEFLIKMKGISREVDEELNCKIKEVLYKKGEKEKKEKIARGEVTEEESESGEVIDINMNKRQKE
ncbi:hypothetical protein CWI38_0010p0010 [Hamiltosporidium tvaerminnensis]|nr:hypothetical protein CWI38_0010p0010 [Hamiltosporidium tvaerminnensis]